MDLNKKLLAIIKNRIKEKKGTGRMDEKSMLTSSCGTSRYLELSRRPSKRKTKRGSNRQTTPTSTQANNVCGSFKNKTTRTNLSDKQLIADLTFSPEDVERVVQYYNIVVEKGLFVPPHSYPNCYAATPPICPEQPLELNSVTYTNYQSSQSPEGYNSNLSQVAVMDSPGTVPDMSPSCTLFESNPKGYNSVSYMVEGTEFTVIEEDMSSYPYVGDYICTVEAEGSYTTCSTSWHQTSITPRSVETESSGYESSWYTQEQQEGFIFTSVSNPAIMEFYTPTIDCRIKDYAYNKANTADGDVIVAAPVSHELLITAGTELPRVYCMDITENEMTIDSPDGVDLSNAIFEQVINL